jgi:ER lumen protein retaining receptor
MAVSTAVLWLFSIGYICQNIGSGIMIYKIKKQHSIYGVSIDTQICLLLASLSRILWFGETKLTSIPLAWLDLLLSILMTSYIVFTCIKKKDALYTEVSKPFKFYILFTVCCVLAFLFHPGKKNKYYLSSQMFVAFTIYMEAIALIPQLVMLRKDGDIGGLTTHYIFSLAMARLFRLIFWVMMHLNGDTFYSLLIADLIHCILLGDFVYRYLKSIKEGRSVLILNQKQKYKL